MMATVDEPPLEISGSGTPQNRQQTGSHHDVNQGLSHQPGADPGGGKQNVAVAHVGAHHAHTAVADQQENY